MGLWVRVRKLYVSWVGVRVRDMTPQGMLSARLGELMICCKESFGLGSRILHIAHLVVRHTNAEAGQGRDIAR